MIQLLPNSAFCAEAGRVDRSMLTDHQLMQIFFTPDDFEEARRELGGDEDNACLWAGVTCIPAHRIDTIEWDRNFDFGRPSLGLSGSIDFSCLPPLLMSLRLSRQKFKGELDTSALPKNLKQFSVRECGLDGAVDLGNLPRAMEYFDVRWNNVSGIVNVHSIPPSIKILAIEEAHVKICALHIGKLPKNECSLVLKVN